jgi:hypothetical protein
MLASSRIGGLVRLALLIATFQLARLRPELSPHAYLWLLTAWVVTCAALTTRRGDDDAAVLDRYLGGRARAVRLGDEGDGLTVRRWHRRP